MVELSAVNQSVVGSSPTCGAIGNVLKLAEEAPAKGVGRESGARFESSVSVTSLNGINHFKLFCLLLYIMNENFTVLLYQF